MPSLRCLSRSMALAVGVLVFAGGCGDSDSPTAPSPPASSTPADVTITILGMSENRSFSPSPAIVRVGQTVAWRNDHTLTHTATADGGGFNTGSIAPGIVSAPIRMTSAGTFSYHCSPHPSMVGSLEVQ